MTPPRADPMSLGVGTLAAERFPAVREALAAAGTNPHDRDAFILLREVAELLHELRPDAGAGTGIAALVAFLHFAYLFWMNGEVVQSVSEEQLAALLSDRSPSPGPTVPASGRPTSYVQLPPLRVWATPIAGQPPEPLDGWFVSRPAGALSLLAIFGLSPTREGFSAVELAGPPPVALQRPDGSPLFAATLTGAGAAGLASLAGAEELLELAWRAEALA